MISVTLLARNSEQHLQQVLESLQAFEEVLLFDNGSTDRTLEIAAKFPNVVIKQGIFSGFGPTHNLASSLAKNDWILSIDTDEVVTPALSKEILSLTLEPETVYILSRQNEYRGRVIKGCGWSPDKVTRLYNRKVTQFSDAAVHEKIIDKGLKKVELAAPLKHYSYRDLHDFLKKMQHYSDLFALDRVGKVTSSPVKALLHGWFAFFKSYLLKKGIFDGYPGFVISLYNGHTAYYKYLKLYEKNLDLKKQSDSVG